MGLRILLLTIAVAMVDCNYTFHHSIPPPQKAFDLHKYVGDWYVQARLPSCAWVGSSEFTNFVSQYSIQPSGNVQMKETWRSWACGSATSDLTPETPSGVYTLKDHIGNRISGKGIVVATDYNNFAIKWGCTKFVGSVCVDPYIVVKTRHREPSPYTWKMIEKLLEHFWQVRLSEMIIITHDKEACVTFSPHRAPYVAPPSVEHLRKTY